MTQDSETFSPEEMEYLSFIEEGEHTLWEIRAELENIKNKNAITGLFTKKLIVLKKGDDTISDPKECVRILNEDFSYASFWWPMMEFELTERGSQFYFNDPEVKEYFAKKKHG